MYLISLRDILATAVKTPRASTRPELSAFFSKRIRPCASTSLRPVLVESGGDLVRENPARRPPTDVENDVNLFAHRGCRDDLLKKRQEISAGMTAPGPAVNFAGLHIECGVQRQRAVPEIFEAVPVSASGRKRQNRVEMIQSLRGRLFIDAENGSMLRRLHV
jgi:hypothetical protein